MPPEKRAAIDPDDLQDRRLNEITAADFLSALSLKGADGLRFFYAWPEKKKYELYVDPESHGTLTLGTLVIRIREKKKIELEKDLRSELFHKHNVAEHEWLHPRDLVTNPAVVDVIREEVASEVARQLRGRG